jgi:hypothetical protein
MLLSLAPRENKESDNKVSVNDLIDEGKVVIIGNNGATQGKANLFRSFDNFPHGCVREFMKDLITKSDFAFFDKRGKRLSLYDRNDMRAVKNLLHRHKDKSKKKKQPLRYLYFHDMKPEDAAQPLGRKAVHKLSQHQNASYKNRARKQLDDIKLVGAQFIFPMRQEMLYCVPMLHERPHGTILSTDMDEANERLAEQNIPNFICKKRLITCVHHSNFKVICPGSEEFFWFHKNVQLDKKQFLQFIMEHGEFDAVIDDKKIGKRISLGFGQIQSTTNPVQLRLHGPSWWMLDEDNEKVPMLDDVNDPNARSVPTLNCTWLEKMKPGGRYSKLKTQLAQILSFGQECFDSYYHDQVKPFGDDFRNNLFGNHLQSFFSEGSFRWEYIDITIQHCDETIPRHMNYKNDWRPGYDHCVVYSFTIEKYTISFLMTSRQTCGDASDRLKLLMSYNKNV